MEEIWKDIPGFEGFYQASSLGRVRSVKRVSFDKRGYLRSYKSKNRTPAIDKDGYCRVWLRTDGKPENRGVHQLIAATFLGYEKDNNNLTINHKNGNKHDNSAQNLEIMSVQDNIQHAINTGLWSCRGESNARAKFSQIQVNKIREEYFKNRDLSQRKLAEKYNVSKSTINRIVHYKNYKSYDH